MLKAPYLKREEIWLRAEEFRRQFVKSPDLIPVPIIEIVELALQIEIRPIRGLLENIDIDGFLAKDLKTLCIDYSVYMDPRKEARLRFTCAHEVGHLVLHQPTIKQCNFRTPQDWIRFREDFSEEDLSWFEHQAYEFAGRLLVPKDRLAQDIIALQPKITKFKNRFPGEDDMLLHAISRLLCDTFKVSSDVIMRRIKRENIDV